MVYKNESRMCHTFSKSTLPGGKSLLLIHPGKDWDDEYIHGNIILDISFEHENIPKVGKTIVWTLEQRIVFCTKIHEY